MTSLLLDLIRGTLSALFIVYTFVVVTHYLGQMILAHRVWRRQRSPAFSLQYPDNELSVDIVVPSYNEEPELLLRCVRSALNQDHKGTIQVWVVDDGSPNRASLDSTYDLLESEGANVVRLSQNVGKRHAQAAVLGLLQGEIFVTLDSDSILARSAVRFLTRQFGDPKIGAITGFVDVENRHKNLLTHIQYLRYWMAFNQERAAQSAMRTVMCCSGPLAAYRRAIVERVKDRYLNQTYGGVACTYGDDRHLTNLVLGEGFDTSFDGFSVAYTHVPESMKVFLKQQLRWNKSFYRELVWTMPYIASRPLWARFDMACMVAMPVMLTVTAGSALVIGMASNPMYLLRYLALIAAAAAVRATYGAVRMRDPRFYLFVLYGFVSAFLLMSVRLRALMTLTDSRWGTRPVAKALSVVNTSPWRAGLTIASMQIADVEPDRPTCAHVKREGARFCRVCGVPVNRS